MKIRENLAHLIDVKTITTFIVLILFSYLAITGKVNGEDVVRVTLIIITFFFAKKSDQSEGEGL